MKDGTPFGRYRLIELVGRGGMGEVWRAFDTGTDRVVAIKVLPAQMAKDPDYETRFRREAKAAAGLNNPHIVPIHDYGEIDGRLFVTMGLIDGHDLATTIAQGPLPPAQAVTIIDQIAGALHAAHRTQLVHRDVKPSNILIDEDGYAYLIDFGIARTATDAKLTSTGTAIGTWAYMAPERFTTSQTDPRVDIYALACVLHETLTGTTPYPGNSVEQIAAGHMFTPPPQPSMLRPGIPPQLDDVIATGMAKNPDERYQTTRELAHAAKAAVTDPGTVPTPLPSTAPAYFHNPYPQQRTERGAQASYDADQPRSAPAPTSSRKGRVIALSALGALAVILAVVAAIVIPNSGDRNEAAGPTATTAAAPLLDTGMFTGTFSAAFGPILAANGTPGSSAPTEFSETFRLRAACGANGCVATASTDGHYASKDLVFDNIGGAWVAVSNSRRTCGSVDDEAWNVISLQPQPDGTMSGEMTQATSTGCFNKRTVTFRRTGETDISLLPDPAKEAVRDVSPAAALHGRYHSVATYANGGIVEYDYAARTDCLRSGVRCISRFVNLENFQAETYVFEGGKWTRDEMFDTNCSLGGTSHVKEIATLELPQPAQDPITLLRGHGYSESTGSACTSQSLDVKYTRTGD